MYSDRPTYEDIYHLLLENLTTLFEAEAIPIRVYNRKKSPDLLVRAINAADRMIASIRKPVETISLYIPSGIHVFPLDSHDTYENDYASSIRDSDHREMIDYFLEKEPWIELRSIASARAQVFDQHPATHAGATSTVARVDGADFKADEDCTRTLAFNVESRLLRLSKPFDSAVFLVFEGTVLPKKFHSNDRVDRRKTRLHTPGVFEDVLLDVAMTKLLPHVADRLTAQDVHALTRNMEAGNGAVVVIPNGQHGGFPD